MTVMCFSSDIWCLLCLCSCRCITEWNGQSSRSERGRRKRRRRKRSVLLMPRLTGMTLWSWKQSTSSPVSKVLEFSAVTSLTCCSLSVGKRPFWTAVGFYSCVSVKEKRESRLVTVCRAGCFSEVSTKSRTALVSAFLPGQQNLSHFPVMLSPISTFTFMCLAGVGLCRLHPFLPKHLGFQDLLVLLLCKETAFHSRN